MRISIARTFWRISFGIIDSASRVRAGGPARPRSGRRARYLRHFDAVEGFNAGVIWSQRGCNRAAQVAAQDLGLPATGGSDAHTLATVGQGYTLFPGGSADDLYRAIKAGEVRWGGSYWSLSQYIDMGRQLVRQHGLRGSLGLAAAGAGLADRQHMQNAK